tara:strand:+ start:173562 stop:174617 length:1056 start_codon:yes stop_codon:yes gene_type:complete
MPVFALAGTVKTSAEIKLEKAKELERIEVDKQRQARIKKRENEAKSLQDKILKLDEKILVMSEDMKTLQAEVEDLDKKEALARQRLSVKLSAFNETAVAIARLERMPVEAMAAASSLRAAHNRKGVVEGGRKSLTGQISKGREDIYELQDIITKRKEAVQKTEALRGQRIEEKKRLEGLFDKQIMLLAADDDQKADLLKKAHDMKQKESLSALLKNYKKSDIYMPKVRAVHEILPVQGKVVRSYNEKDKNGVRAHGITIESTASEPVTAIKDGRVIYSDRFREYGYIVILEHADGSNSLYSGMNGSSKEVGDFLFAGKKIGLMPNESKPELYLEIRKNGKTVNPASYLAQK